MHKRRKTVGYFQPSLKSPHAQFWLTHTGRNPVWIQQSFPLRQRESVHERRRDGVD